MSAAPQQGHDLPQLRAAATADLDGLVRDLSLQINKQLTTARTYRFGTNGSGKLERVGRNRGLFHLKDGTVLADGRDGGDVFQLVMWAHNCRLGEAIRWLADRYGDTPVTRPAIRPVRAAEPDPEQQAEDARAIRVARDFAQAAEPVTGTVAERYLTGTTDGQRHVPTPPAWPDAIRHHAATRSLLLVATRSDGTITACQRVRLTPEARKAEGTPERPTKVTNGRLDGAFVRLPAFRSYSAAEAQPLLVCEGPETGIAAWACTGHETHIVLGVSSMPKAAVPTVRLVVLCRDDDPRESPADKAVRRALTAWKEAGAQVVVATPWAARRFDKSDIADVVRDEGPRAVAKRIAIALAPSGPTTKQLPIGEVRKIAETVIPAFFRAAAAYDPDLAETTGDLPPVHAVRLGVGVGKSHIARHEAVRMLIDMREAGDDRTIVFADPTHRLASEQEKLLREAHGAHITARTWIGRSGQDPDNPGQTMCRDLDAVADAQSIGLDPQTTVCRQKKRGEKERTCPFFEGCAYQRQRKAKADLWLVAHELLYGEKPATFGDVAAVVVDERAWQDSLEGVALRIDNGEPKHIASLTLALDALGTSDRRIGDDRDADWLTLSEHRARAMAILRRHPDGPLQRAAFASFPEADAVDARALEFTRKLEPKIYPGMSRAERRALVKAAEENRLMLLRARFWRALAALLANDGPAHSGWVTLATVAGENGPQRVLLFKGRRDVKSGWQVPTLLLDATLDLDLVRPFWPQVSMTANAEAAAPHQRVRQVTDRAYAKSRLTPLDEKAADARPEVARSRLRALREVRDIVSREARRFPSGRVLMVSQKAPKEGLIAMGLPPNVEPAHHNAIAGMDVWRDVQLEIVVGRTMPRTVDVERAAEALTGAAVDHVDDYERATTGRLIVGRGMVPCETSRHPHPVAEAVRWQACEGELVQIIGRGRGVNRTAATPLELLVLTDVVLPLPINEEITAASLEPTLPDRMLGASGIVLTNPGHAADAWPELWANRNTAKTAFARGQMGSFPNEISTHTGLNPSAVALRRVAYQRGGARHSPAEAWFCSALCPDPAAWLTERLGPLAWCRIDPDPEPPSGPRPPSSEPPPPPANDPEPSTMPERSPAPAAAAPPPVFDPPDLVLSVRLRGGGTRRLTVFGPLEAQRVVTGPPEPRLRLVWPPPVADHANDRHRTTGASGR